MMKKCREIVWGYKFQIKLKLSSETFWPHCVWAKPRIAVLRQLSSLCLSFYRSLRKKKKRFSLKLGTLYQSYTLDLPSRYHLKKREYIEWKEEFYAFHLKHKTRINSHQLHTYSSTVLCLGFFINFCPILLFFFLQEKSVEITVIVKRRF